MQNKEKFKKLDTVEDFLFHMIIDKKTEMYVKFAKIMVIRQGPYTKQRQDVFKRISEVFKSASRLLSDTTYKDEFRSQCSYETVEEFYTYLKEEVKIAVETGFNLVYIDTTMSNLMQNQFYCAVANKMQYTLLIMPPVVTKSSGRIEWPKGSQADSFRDLTRVEAPNMFQHLFCAWFLHDMDTEELRNECLLYVNDLFEKLEEFSKWFSKIGDANMFPKHFGLVPDDVMKEQLVMREDLAFCPVKVFTSDFEMSAYFAKPAVMENYGKMSKLQVIGFVISPHMVAARVKLTHRQKDLWEMNDNVREDAYLELFPTELYNQSKSDLPLPDPDVKRICTKSNTTLIKGENFVQPVDQITPFTKGRTCHIVLGTSPNASNADIDYGVAFAVNRDFKASQSNQKDVNIGFYNLEKSQVKRIGKYWFIYLKDTLVVNGFFASCCKPLKFDTPLQTSKNTKSLK